MGVKDFTDLAWISREAETKLSDLVELQGEIGNGQFGLVKKAYINGSSVTTVGGGFQAWNASGTKQATGVVAIMGKDYQDRPFFYKGGGQNAGTTIFNGFYYDLGSASGDCQAYSASSASQIYYTSYTAIPSTPVSNVVTYAAWFSGTISGGDPGYYQTQVELWDSSSKLAIIVMGGGLVSATVATYYGDNQSYSGNATRARGRLVLVPEIGGDNFSAQANYGFGMLTCTDRGSLFENPTWM